MKFITCFFFYFFLLAFPLVGYSTTNIDSLLNVLEEQKDTAKIETLFAVSVYYQQIGDVPKAKSYCQRAIDLSTKERNMYFLCRSLNVMGGTIYSGTGEFSKAIEYLLDARSLAEEGQYLKLLYQISNNLGNVYKGQKNYTKALEYYETTYNIALRLNDLWGQNIAILGKGGVYADMGETKKAINAMEEAAKGFYALKKNVASLVAATNLGQLYTEIKEYDKAIECLNKCYPLAEKMQDKYNIGGVLNNLAMAYLGKGNYNAALEQNYKAMDIYKSTSKNYDLIKTYTQMAETYSKLAKSDSVYHYMKLAIECNDTIYAQEGAKQTAEMQTKYDTKAKEKENELLLVEQERKNTEIKKQKQFQLGLWLFIAVVAVFGFFQYRSSKQKQKQNLIISKQKEQVESQRTLLHEKNKEITDSINYAKRLQDAILPDIAKVQEYFRQSFILYKPKDIVAGDFYWMQGIGNNILLAAADCTGHGVPGAMMSIVCSNALNKTVNELGIIQPGEILDKVRVLVTQTFAKEKRDIVNDGMDISLVSIAKTTTDMVQVKWAGANNPLWIIRPSETLVSVERGWA